MVRKVDRGDAPPATFETPDFFASASYRGLLEAVEQPAPNRLRSIRFFFLV